MIYELVLGSQVITISYRYLRVKHRNTRIVTTSPLVSSVPSAAPESIIVGAQNCIASPSRALERLDLSLLKVCKQIWREANDIPYASNLWACESPNDLEVFTDFVRNWAPHQKQKVRKVYLTIYRGARFRNGKWLKSVLKLITKVCTQVRELQINFTSEWCFDAPAAAWRDGPNIPDEVVKQALQLGVLPLEQVTVVNERCDEIRWPLDDQIAWTNSIRDRLLTGGRR